MSIPGSIVPPSITLKERLQEDVKTALRAGDKARLSILRMALAAIKQHEIDSRNTLSDDAVLSLLRKMVKQRQEAIGHFQRGNRDDLVAKETTEIEMLKEYLPEPLDEAGTLALVENVIATAAASSQKDMGSVMSEIKARAAGTVDLGRASALVRSLLSER